MKLAVAVILIGLPLVAALPVVAAQHEPPPLAQPAGQHWATGTVKKLNPNAGKVTINHGPLADLEMPAMTMVFRVKDPAWLNQMKPGDHIRFVVERLDGALTITAIQPAP